MVETCIPVSSYNMQFLVKSAKMNRPDLFPTFIRRATLHCMEDIFVIEKQFLDEC